MKPQAKLATKGGTRPKGMFYSDSQGECVAVFLSFCGTSFRL